MEATTKEHQLSKDTLKNMVIVFLFGIIISFLGFKVVEKPSYSPIVITAPVRSLNTSYQPNANRNVSVTCSVSITSTLSLAGGQSGTISLQMSPDNITYTTVQTATNNNTGTLTVGLNTSAAQACALTCTVPMGYYYKLATSGSSTFSILQTQETAF
jgi:hypothetical protein